MYIYVGIKYSKPLVCLCKHTAIHVRIWRGCPAGGRLPHVTYFLALSFALQPVSYSLQSRQRCPTVPTPTPTQNWSATLYSIIIMDSRRALPGLQGVGHGLQCKAEGQETLTVRLPTSDDSNNCYYYC